MGQESAKKLGVSPSDLVFQNAPQETPQRLKNLLRSKEQLLNISNFIFGESPDINGFTDHEKAGFTSGKQSISKVLDPKKEQGSSMCMATPEASKG